MSPGIMNFVQSCLEPETEWVFIRKQCLMPHELMIKKNQMFESMHFIAIPLCIFNINEDMENQISCASLKCTISDFNGPYGSFGIIFDFQAQYLGFEPRFWRQSSLLQTKHPER